MLHASMSECMGTQIDVLLVGEDESFLQGLWREIETLLGAMERSLSRFDAEGELYHLNENGAMMSVELSDLLWEVLKECREYNQLTNGYFDITLGSALNLVLDSDDRSAYFIDETMSLDLGAYGKGCALECIRERLKAEGVESAFVNFGNSSILALGCHPCGDCWPIAVADPYSGEPLAEYKLKDSVLTVSGNTPSHAEHIINPHTGEYDIRRRVVAIESNDPKLGEALTTSMMLMPDSEVDELYERVRGRIKSRYIKNL